MFKNLWKKLDLYEQCLIKRLWKGLLVLISLIGLMFVTTWRSGYDAKVLSDLLYLILLIPCATIMFCAFIPGPALIYDLIRYHICWQYGEFVGDDSFYMCIYKPSPQSIKTIIIGSDDPNQRYTIVVYNVRCNQYRGEERYMYDVAFAFFDNKDLFELHLNKDFLCEPSYYVEKLSNWGGPEGPCRIVS